MLLWTIRLFRIVLSLTEEIFLIEDLPVNPRTIEPPNITESRAGGYGDLDASGGFEPTHIVWLRLIWKERRFVGRVVAYGLIISTIIAFVIPPRYTSTTELMPPDSQSSIASTAMMAVAAQSNLASTGGVGEKLSGVAGDLLGLKTSGALFNTMLQSRTIENRLIQRFDLRKVYWRRYWEDTRKKLESNTSISEDRKSGVITITVTDHDPHRAQQLAQAYVEELDRLVAQVSTSSARRERVFIEERLKTVKQDLDSAAQRFSQYASKNEAVDITAQEKATVEGAARLQGELIAAQSELEGLGQIYTGNNVRVRSLRARVDELQRQLQKIGGNNSGALSADTNPTGPNSQSGFPSIRELPLLGVRWAELYRDTKIQEAVYQMLTQQYEVAKIQEAKEIPSVKVLDPADVPEKRSFPPRRAIITMGGIGSLMLGLIALIALEIWKKVDPGAPGKQFLMEIWDHCKGWIVSVRRGGPNPTQPASQI
jgi:capsule polysaccharide export protein KpsE/RkpR